MKGAGTLNRESTKGRDRLLEAAREVFYEDGYQKASMREVARRIGMSQAAIYYHFADKEDLLFTLIDDFTERFSETLMSAVASGVSPQEKLSNLIAAQLDMLVENQRDLKILSQDKGHLSKMRRRLIRSKERTVLEIYRACLGEVRKGGGLTGVDSTVAAFTIIGAINWLYQWYRPDEGLPWTTVKESILKMVLQGVGMPGVPAEPAGPARTKQRKERIA